MTPETLTWPVDLDTLLAPISDLRPTGESLRLDVYDQIREARRGDDPNLPQRVWQTELKRADWPRVESLCHDALATRSKDLQLAAWLLEAWLHLHGFAGAAPGLSLTTGLCEHFWDTLYPENDGADLEGRLAPIYWLNEKLSLLLRAIPITEPRARRAPMYLDGLGERRWRAPAFGRAGRGGRGTLPGQCRGDANRVLRRALTGPARWAVRASLD